MLIVGLVLLLSVSETWAQKPTREQKVRADKAKVESEGFWIYNDLPKAFEQAKQTGKPLLVVLRCIPCEECVKLDDDLIDRNPVVRPLLEKFVCARVVSTNGLDLATFQYDYDQSFATFMLNADGTIYCRFGTRSHRTEWLEDVSVEGLAEALTGALELHAAYPGNRAALASKRGPAPLVASPEQFPSLKEKYTSSLNYTGNVVQSCIHCHQVGEAIRETYRARSETIPDDVLFPYPHPKSQGLILDPQKRAVVTSVVAGSSAERAGFKPGDSIRTLEGQPLLSMADVQWVLHRTAPTGGALKVVVEREGKPVELTWTLADGWRHDDNISWRVSSWMLRRTSFGGMLLKQATDEERKGASIEPGKMALRVDYVGQFGTHANAKKAGIQVGDIVTSYDGRTDLLREDDALVYGVNHLHAGDELKLSILRQGKPMEIKVTLPP
jgi:S1-C subfamily serine protease